MLAGVPGFVQAPDPYHLNIGAGLLPADPLDGALQAGSDVGMLGIELQSRRRNRVNGRIEAIGPDGLQVAVSQSFGNRPRYIQLRAVRTVAPAPLPARAAGGSTRPRRICCGGPTRPSSPRTTARQGSWLPAAPTCRTAAASPASCAWTATAP